MKEKNTEKKILEAAKIVFIEKGKDGATMQSIADKAGINKALLHYYFRSKDKLFNKIVELTIHHFLPRIEKAFLSDLDFFERIRIVIKEYITILSNNPFIPAFILHEVNRNPEGILKLVMDSGIRFDLIAKKIDIEIQRGIINISSPQHFLANLLSLCIFPIAARPLLQPIIFSNDKIAYDQFIEERKTQTADFFIQAIKA